MTPGQRLRPPPRLLTVEGPSILLGLVLVAVSILASLVLILSAATLPTLQAWRHRLAGDVTLATAGRGLESSDAAAARIVERAAALPGVERAAVLNPRPDDVVAARLLGVRASDPDLGPPRLVAVKFRAGEMSAEALTHALRGEGLAVAADDHGAWSGPLERAVLEGAAVAAGALILLLLIWFMLVGLGAGGAVRREADRASLLIRLGAFESTLAAPFRIRLALAGGVTALAGALLAAAVAGLIAWTALGAPLRGLAPIPFGEIEARSLAAAAIWPALALVAAAWAGGSAATARLRRLS